MLQCLTKIVTAKELDLRPLGKVIIFRDKQTDRTFLLYIDTSWSGIAAFRMVFSMRRTGTAATGDLGLPKII